MYLIDFILIKHTQNTRYVCLHLYNNIDIFQSRSSSLCIEPPYPSKETRLLCEKSLSSLKEGVALFEGVADKANTALLYMNKGRLMRLHAQICTQNTMLQDQPQFTDVERHYYKEVRKIIM